MPDQFDTIDLSTLDHVTGGRYVKGEDRLKPELIQMVAKLAEAVQGIGQAKVANEQQQFAQIFQLMQKRMGMG
jgi:hypothetical protein